jgi:hypothetical protein
VGVSDFTETSHLFFWEYTREAAHFTRLRETARRGTETTCRLMESLTYL